MYTFSFFPPINPEKLLAVPCLPATNFVFIKSDENNSSSNSTPSFWSDLETIIKRKELSTLMFQNFTKIHVKKMAKEAR